jgi:hypothetical protein
MFFLSRNAQARLIVMRALSHFLWPGPFFGLAAAGPKKIRRDDTIIPAWRKSKK